MMEAARHDPAPDGLLTGVVLPFHTLSDETEDRTLAYEIVEEIFQYSNV